MPVPDIAVEQLVLARTHRIQEIRPVIGAFALGVLRFGKRLLFAPTKRLPGAAADFEPAFGTIEKISDFLALTAFVVGITPAGFQFYNLSVRIGESSRLGVRRFLGRPVMTIRFDIAV